MSLLLIQILVIAGQRAVCLVQQLVLQWIIGQALLFHLSVDLIEVVALVGMLLHQILYILDGQLDLIHARVFQLTYTGTYLIHPVTEIGHLGVEVLLLDNTLIAGIDMGSSIFTQLRQTILQLL
uniref:Putative secreted protein n=1 Tax=Anopheles marajoara TaxID=58244 RepID=A0A2M4C7P5_9DIPT